MTLYAVDKLMVETRRLASDYYRLTGKALPVSSELAKYDVSQIMGFRAPEEVESGVDLIASDDWGNKKVMVKSRVIFEKGKSKPRVGQLNFDGFWDLIVLELMNPDYEPIEIYIATRETLEKSVSSSKNKRGAISVAKFKSISQKVWPKD